MMIATLRSGFFVIICDPSETGRSLDEGERPTLFRAFCCRTVPDLTEFTWFWGPLGRFWGDWVMDGLVKEIATSPGSSQ